ncbi:sugar phosphate isomerase/epimerase family protein [Candidatus Enterococcus mangumiae]|uniref:Xylose isomerase-like TIM barrel domain-containing protein n=1 Tax=Candidatus Enterococcus mangumiae TaxID=2230878 RepID=A0ABZ2SWB4_9ENTE|nr:sugar phosphate isomerase/epimerase family protein [Enterococcus sp. DIV1094]MBO0489112.1 TIM barrel protein [Enterococcus sp. DIV1094]
MKLNLVARGHDLTTVQSVDDLAKKASEQEISTLQLALSRSFPDLATDSHAINPGMGHYIKQALAKEDVSVGILSCYINMIHPDLSVRETVLRQFERYLQYAASFGATMVATETGSVSEAGYTEKNFSDEAFSQIVEAIRQLVRAGEKHRMMVGIEPGLNHPLYSLDRVAELIAAIDSDYLGIILDPTNLITAENHHQQVGLVEEAFERFGEKICGLHLKDYLVSDEGEIVPVDLGTGMIDYEAIVKIAQKHRPYLYIVLEETKDSALKHAVSVLDHVTG